MTRIALISDIHANEVALRAVLAEIRRTGVDQVICLGDVATLGPRPNAVIEILGELGCRCIMGNHDEFLLDAELVRTYTAAPQVVASINWTRCHLSRVELDFLRGFERSCEITLAKSTVQLFHGSPRSHMEDILASTQPEALDAMLTGTAVQRQSRARSLGQRSPAEFLHRRGDRRLGDAVDYLDGLGTLSRDWQ
jgi:predicted phosphodiesterase